MTEIAGINSWGCAGNHGINLGTREHAYSRLLLVLHKREDVLPQLWLQVWQQFQHFA